MRQHKQGRNTKLAEPDVIKPGQTFNGDVLYPLCYFLSVYIPVLFFSSSYSVWYLPLFCPLQPIPVCVLLRFRAVSSGRPLESTCFRKSSYTENQYNWRAAHRANVKEYKTSREPQGKKTKWHRQKMEEDLNTGDGCERVRVKKRGDKCVRRPSGPWN